MALSIIKAVFLDLKKRHETKKKTEEGIQDAGKKKESKKSERKIF